MGRHLLLGGTCVHEQHHMLQLWAASTLQNTAAAAIGPAELAFDWLAACTCQTVPGWRHFGAAGGLQPIPANSRNALAAPCFPGRRPWPSGAAIAASMCCGEMRPRISPLGQTWQRD